jgi:alpha-glucosidase
MDPVRQSTSHPPASVRELHVYDGLVERGSVLYDDAGDGYGYRDGEYCLQRFVVTGTAKALQIMRTEEGAFSPHYDRYEVVLHGMISPKVVIDCDGERLEPELRSGGRVLAIVVPRTFQVLTVSK